MRDKSSLVCPPHKFLYQACFTRIDNTNFKLHPLYGTPGIVEVNNKHVIIPSNGINVDISSITLLETGNVVTATLYAVYLHVTGILGVSANLPQSGSNGYYNGSFIDNDWRFVGAFYPSPGVNLGRATQLAGINQCFDFSAYNAQIIKTDSSSGDNWVEGGETVILPGMKVNSFMSASYDVATQTTADIQIKYDQIVGGSNTKYRKVTIGSPDPNRQYPLAVQNSLPSIPNQIEVWDIGFYYYYNGGSVTVTIDDINMLTVGDANFNG